MTAKVKVKKYKLKTHKGTAKRISITGSGLFLHGKAGKNHLRRKKSKRTAALRGVDVIVSPGDVKRHVKRLLPYA